MISEFWSKTPVFKEVSWRGFTNVIEFYQNDKHTSRRQFIQKPPSHPVITESTPLSNPYWDYSRNKIACEERITHAEDFARGFVGLLGHQQAAGHVFHITSDEILTWDQIYRAVADAARCELNAVHIPSDFISRCESSLTGTLTGDKAVSVIFDNSKIKRFVPDFRATIPFRQGIRRTLAWFEADPARQVMRKGTDELMDRIIKAFERGA